MSLLVEEIADVNQLWQEFVECRDNQIRERLLMYYLPLVRQVAGRVKVGLMGAVEFEELVNAGLMGLIKSVDNFDPDRGFKFETYASTRIRGSIIDGLRDMDWLPRSYRRKSRELDQAMTKLIGEKGRVPEDAEIAGELGLDGDEYTKFMDSISIASLLSLDTMLNVGEEGQTASLHDVIPDEEAIDPHEKVENLNQIETVIKLIESLNAQERAVVTLYYYEELTFKEIGLALNVSESRISQIHTKLIAALRAMLRQLQE